jgi:hypothetical protein
LKRTYTGTQKRNLNIPLERNPNRIIMKILGETMFLSYQDTDVNAQGALSCPLHCPHGTLVLEISLMLPVRPQRGWPLVSTI